MNASPFRLALACTVLAVAMPVAAQDAMQGMDMPEHATHAPTQHGHAARKAKPPAAPTQAKPAAQSTHDMAPMPADAMPGMHHAPPPSVPRSPDYSDGYTYGPMPGMDMPDDAAFGALLLDRLEYVHTRGGGHATAIDGEAWYGRNFDKLWVKFEGEHADGRMQDMRIEALWAHALAPFWDTQLGVRHDVGVGPGRTCAAFGVEGLAPYWFETQATLYIGQGGRTAARVSAQYEARFTQRLILTPSLEANFHGRGDPQRGIGAGLSDAELGLRLRYEIRREFAPYVGVVWQQRFGRTRELVHAQGESGGELQFVAGLRLWF